MKSFDPLKTTLFSSPWAVRRQDEEFFEASLSTLGGLVGGDTKLGTLFSTLVLLTPGATLSEHTRVDV